MPRLRVIDTSQKMSRFGWVCGFFLSMMLCAAMAASNPAEEVLVLYSYHQHTWTDDIHEGLTEILNQRTGIIVRTEYMDTKFYFDDAYLEQLLQLYTRKYTNTTFDVIIAADDNAYDFARAHQQDIFKNAPLVFCGVSDFSPSEIEGREITGVMEIEPYQETLSFAMDLLPDTEVVYLLADHSLTAQYNANLIRAYAKENMPTLELRDFENMTNQQVQEAMTQLPENAFVLMIAWWSDTTEQQMQTDTLGAMLNSCNRPIFGVSQINTEQGLILGGCCISPIEQGRVAGQFASRILDGEKASSIPVETDSGAGRQYAFNYAQIKRQGFSVKQFPEEAVIYGMPRSFYHISHQTLNILILSIVMLAIVGTGGISYAVHVNVLRKKLILREEHFRNLVEMSNDWIWEIDANLRYTYASPHVRNILGYKPEEILGKRPFDLMHPDEAARIKKIFDPIYREKRFVQHLENVNLHKGGQEVVLETNAAPILDKSGKVTGYRGVDRDVTVRKFAEKKVIEERDKAQRFLDIAGVMILALDKQGCVTLLNRRGCQILQCNEEEVLGRNWFESFLPFSYREIVRSFFERVMSTGVMTADYFENPVLTRRGAERLIAWHIVAIRDSFGAITGVLCSGEDITSKRSAEIAARESDERLRIALSAVEMGTWRWLPETNEDTRDANLNALMGLEPVESTQNIEEFFQFVHPDDRDAAKDAFNRAIIKQEPFQSRFRIVQPDGHVRWVLNQGRPFYDFNGKLEYITGVVVDITKRQAAANALRESEQRYRSFIQLATEGIARFEFKEPMSIHLPVEEQVKWISNKGILAECNDHFAQMYGYKTASDFIGAKTFDLWNDEAVANKVIPQLIRDGYQWTNVETHEITQAGEHKYFLNNMVCIIEDDHLVTQWLSQLDITEQVANRKALEESEERLRVLFEQAAELILVCSYEGRLLQVNEYTCRSTGYSREELVGTRITDIDIDITTPASLEKLFNILETEDSYTFETHHRRKDGTVYPVEMTLSKLKTSQGDAIIGVGRDITERKAVENILRDREQRLSILFEKASNATYVSNSEGHFTEVNEQACKDTGYSREELLGMNVIDIDADVPSVDKMMEFWASLRPNHPITFETHHRRKDGSVFPVEITVSRLETPDGTFIMGIVRDITERLKAEQRFHEQRAELQSIFRAAPVGIGVVVDRELVRVNARICEMLGYTEEELVGQSARMLYPTQEEFEYVGREKYQQITDHGTGTVETRWLRKDGKIIDVLLSSTPFDNDDWSKGVTFTALDITERKKAEQALDFTQFAVDHVGEAAFWTKADARFVYVNEAACQSLGYTREELLEMSIFDIDPDLVPEQWQGIWEHVRTHGTHHIESRHRRKDGRVFPVELTGNFIVYDGVEYSIAFARDITERKRDAEALAESEQRFRNIVESSPMGIHTYRLNPDGKLIMTGANEASAEILGRDFTAEIGRTIEEIFPGLIGTEVPDMYRRLCLEGGTYQGNNFEYHDDIVNGFYEFTAFQTSHGKMAVLFMDVTDRILGQRALQFTQFAVDHAGEAAYWMNTSGKFVYINEMACRSLGYTRDELLHMSVADIDPDFPIEIWPNHWEHVRQEKVMRFESHHRTKDGHVFPVEITANFVAYDGAEYICAFARDISDRKSAEQMRELLMEQLQEHNDELQSIVYTATHDLRSPLVNISGFTGELKKDLSRLSDIIKRESLSPEGAQSIQRLLDGDVDESLSLIQFGSHQMDALLNGLLRLSKIGSAPIAVRPLEMNSLLAKVVEGLQYQINESGVLIDIQPQLPKCLGDEVLLIQVFTNLIDNAIKYSSPDRESVIELSGFVTGEMVEYRVDDNGIGIHPEDTDKVFELFHRLGHFDDKDGEGMGLTIVRRVLNRLNGSVHLTSRPGQGTTVHVQLPKG